MQIPQRQNLRQPTVRLRCDGTQIGSTTVLIQRELQSILRRLEQRMITSWLVLVALLSVVVHEW